MKPFTLAFVYPLMDHFGCFYILTGGVLAILSLPSQRHKSLWNVAAGWPTKSTSLQLHKRDISKNKMETN